jgi:hypothetical protein
MRSVKKTSKFCLRKNSPHLSMAAIHNFLAFYCQKESTDGNQLAWFDKIITSGAPQELPPPEAQCRRAELELHKGSEMPPVKLAGSTSETELACSEDLIFIRGPSEIEPP